MNEREALIHAAKAHDREEAAQQDKPSPWDGGDTDPDWIDGRVAAMRAGIDAYLEAAERDGALADIAAERRRQVEAEGWTPKHDDEHNAGQMAAAAACYASPAAFDIKEVPRRWSDDSRYMNAQSEPIESVLVPTAWPWDGEWWKPSADYRRKAIGAHQSRNPIPGGRATHWKRRMDGTVVRRDE